MPLQRLLYRSRSTFGEDRCPHLAAIIHSSRRNNPRQGITGALTLCGATYLQVLEGQPEHVARLMEVLERDPRHKDIHVIGQWAVSRRLFSGWGMALAFPFNAPEAVRERLRHDQHGLGLVGILFDLANRAPLSL